MRRGSARISSVRRGSARSSNKLLAELDLAVEGRHSLVRLLPSSILAMPLCHGVVTPLFSLTATTPATSSIGPRLALPGGFLPASLRSQQPVVSLLLRLTMSVASISLVQWTVKRIMMVVVQEIIYQVVANLSKVFPKDRDAPPAGVDDMTKLSYLHEPAVLQNLARRYELNEIYNIEEQHLES